MALSRSAEITALLKAWTGGDQAALDQLAAQVYDELRRMARHHMNNERAGNTLQTTALVNEVYFRMGPLHAIADENSPTVQQSGLAS